MWWTPSFSDDRASIQIELLFLLFLYQQAFTKHRCFIELKDWTGFFGTYKVWGSDNSPFIQMVIKDSECLATTQLCLLSNPKLLTCHHFTDWGCFQRPVRVLGSNESLVGGSTSYTKGAQSNQTPSTMMLHLHWSFNIENTIKIESGEMILRATISDSVNLYTVESRSDWVW